MTTATAESVACYSAEELWTQVVKARNSLPHRSCHGRPHNESDREWILALRNHLTLMKEEAERRNMPGAVECATKALEYSVDPDHIERTIMAINIEAVTDAIKSGELDGCLTTLSLALEKRKGVLTKIAAANLDVGDIVHFSDKVKPRYLTGLYATVAKINPQSVVVDCPNDPEYQKYAGAHNVRCPNNIIKELS